MAAEEARERHIEIRRTARYFTLGAPGSATREVWFVLHGYSQLASTFIVPFRDLDDGTRIVVAPEALNRFYLVSPAKAPASQRPVGATWMTREDREHEIADYVAYLDALHAHIMKDLDRKRVAVRVVGFSQGVATAVRWIARGHVQSEQLVCWAGTLPPDVEPATLARLLDGASICLVAGSRDALTTPEIVEAEGTRLRTAGVTTRVIRFEGGHALSRKALRELVSVPLSPAAAGDR